MIPFVFTEVDCYSKLIERGGCSDIDRALQEELGFKIPIPKSNYATLYPDVFEYGEWEYSDSVGLWLKHNLLANSKHDVISLDYAWIGVLDGFLSGLILYCDQHDPTSTPNPDLTIVYNNCVVLKAEARATALQMVQAESSLTSKFQGKAYEMFPLSSTIVGICSSATLVKIFKISYNRELQTYETLLIPRGDYNVGQLSERVRFLVDILKIARWILSVKRPWKSFHLVPNIRTATKNRHYITWNGISLIKEFKLPIDLQYIARVYAASLENVEHGEVILADSPSIRIDRIGKPLTKAISDGFDKRTAFAHIEAGVEQLRSLDLGHGDIKINNIFVDESGVAFLADLEYCAPLGTIIPKERRPKATLATNVRKIEEFDAGRLGELKLALEKL